MRPVNSEWKMKFDWYLPEADYLILSLDADYQRTVIGVPDRKYVWIMSRTPVMPEAEYDAAGGGTAGLRLRHGATGARSPALARLGAPAELLHYKVREVREQPVDAQIVDEGGHAARRTS